MKRIFAIFVVAALACTLVFATACVTDANVTTEQLLEAMSAPGDIQSISVTVSNGELNTADYRLIYSYYADGSGEPSENAKKLNLRVYTPEELTELMKCAGFDGVETYRNGKFIAVIGKKGGK